MQNEYGKGLVTSSVEVFGNEVPVLVGLALRGSEEARQLLAGLSGRKEWVVCYVRPPKAEAGEDACYQRVDTQLRWEREDGTVDYGPSFSAPVGADVVFKIQTLEEREILPNVWLERLTE